MTILDLEDVNIEKYSVGIFTPWDRRIHTPFIFFKPAKFVMSITGKLKTIFIQTIHLQQSKQ
ncbi:MAG: hypothetical protein J7619_09860 [Dyadobacter sp.]|uniref:hypothetical protein n=1 Tax=Dyadobacter sp. TaxID=1914288 RepID=UPI001B11988A|nr:hypothetical protein [Dyadobacter sp.]MBO9612990.1 hypothetical protein [Dyadobacter sp.]